MEKILGLILGGNNLCKIVKIFKLPISTVYDTIKRHENTENLKSAPRSGHPKIPEEIYNKLIESMPKSIEECIFNNGWPTEYLNFLLNDVLIKF